jgi:hypothetical protein
MQDREWNRVMEERSRFTLHEPALRPQDAEVSGGSAYQREAVDHVVCRLGDRSCAGAHALALGHSGPAHPSGSAQSVLKLQRQYGNRYVQQVLGLSRGSSSHGVSTPVVEPYPLEAAAPHAFTEPLVEEGNAGGGPEQELSGNEGEVLAAERGCCQSAANLKSVLSPPDPSSAGAAVICKGQNKYEVWVNPSSSACAVPCMKKHEEKHITDFEADPDYKAATKCKGSAEGDVVVYNNDADAKRFECAASDVEIKCIEEQLKTEKDENCKKTLATRKDTTLPNYKKRFGC